MLWICWEGLIDNANVQGPECFAMPLIVCAMFRTEKQKKEELWMKSWLRRRNQRGLCILQRKQLVMLPGQLALTGYCRFLLNIPPLFHSHNRNIKIMSVNPSHQRIIWADNLFRPALNREHPRDCLEGHIGPKICPVIL